MFQKRISIYLLLVLFILIISAIFIWWQQNQSKQEVANWDNPDYVFNIAIPDDFDEYKIERLQKKIDEARTAYTEEKEQNYTWDIIGNMYEFVRDYERALVAYHKSFDKEPNDVIAILNIATINEEQFANYTEAEKYYSEAIKIFPQMPDVYDRLALLYWRKMGRIEDAETIYLQGLEQTNNHSDVFFDIIKFYEQTDQPDKRLIYIKKLLETYPDNQVYQNEFGHLIK